MKRKGPPKDKVKRKSARTLIGRAELSRRTGLDPDTVERRLAKAGVRPVTSTYIGTRGYNEYDEAQALVALTAAGDSREIENEVRLIRAQIKDIKRGLRSGAYVTRREFVADLRGAAAEYRNGIDSIPARTVDRVADVFRDKPGHECAQARLVPLTPGMREQLLAMVREEFDVAAVALRNLLEKYSEVK